MLFEFSVRTFPFDLRSYFYLIYTFRFNKARAEGTHVFWRLRENWSVYSEKHKRSTKGIEKSVSEYATQMAILKPNGYSNILPDIDSSDATVAQLVHGYDTVSAFLLILYSESNIVSPF